MQRFKLIGPPQPVLSIQRHQPGRVIRQQPYFCRHFSLNRGSQARFELDHIQCRRNFTGWLVGDYRQWRCRLLSCFRGQNPGTLLQPKGQFHQYPQQHHHADNITLAAAASRLSTVQ